jgi:hypothetical protein
LKIKKFGDFPARSSGDKNYSDPASPHNLLQERADAGIWNGAVTINHEGCKGAVIVQEQ